MGGRAKHSNFHLQLLRGEYRKKAESQVYEVLWFNDFSVKVRPWGSSDKYGTQFNRRYIQPLEDERVDEKFCRYCRKPITADEPDALPDIDPVTGENVGFYHGGCMPEEVDSLSSSTPSRV